MTTTVTPTATPPARTVRPPRKARPNGQWALDGRKPLNDNEAFKQAGAPLEVRERILSTYAPGGFETIAPDDLNGRFRWWGLYTQRKQGIDGGRTAQLDASELSDRYFLQRVRLDGGSLSREQLRALGSVSNDFARGTADITDRQNIQLHWVEIGSVPELWRRLESVGLTTIEGCGDTPRGFLVSPVAGIAKDEVIDPTPLAEAIRSTYLGDPELANLPRKFKTAITGSPSLDILHEINDISFVGVEHPDLGPGYDLWVAGALSTAPRLGQRLGAFVPPEDALEVWYGVIRIFRDYGYRRLRNKARLKFLMAEWGPERFRRVLEDDYLGRALPDGPPPREPSGDSDHIGVHEQKDGRFWVGAKPPVGRLSGDVLLGLADLAEAVGSDRARTTPLQNLLLLDVPAEKVDEAVAGLRALGLDPDPGDFSRTTLACTGLEFCKFAIVETKRLAARVSAELDERLADTDLDRRITLTVNGCPNSCARIQIADIGLKGQIITVDGEQVPGFQVHLGGGLATSGRAEAGLGRTVRGLKVPAAGLTDYVERLVRRYLDQRLPEESFAQWAHRAEEEDLA
ncbi:nitrite/sulfite reductase [Actinomyces viscosus]|uniref:assimilatory sulfite reductase (ferredoxin) n=1 Tax=Actinomyces viscosus TaxID=1656 RepID=A0A3S4VDS7_ACTVI|nr:nitrite/sulfite reductase [Actinomyces viscosus]TFH53180.1 nitrite/sulfite reductase [Actinomyces viscosus]VEI15538.1 Sulfite reductase [ferredoxin] [Actinomyces viscosus]